MERQLPEIKKASIPDYPKTLKDKLKENLNKIWVHNSPWSSVEELLNINKINENIKHDLEIFGLDKENINRDILKINFQKSKIFKWLINQIRKEQKNEIYFGKLSTIIHNSLLDDPKPYRKDVKNLQSNIYDFIKN